jgi:hypothetical protein
VSFFDDDDPPTRVTSRSRRPSRPAAPRRVAADGGGSGGGADRQTVRTRQAVALGLGVLVLILLIFGIKGCLDSRAERALKDYNRNVAAIISDSDQQVAKPFFQLLGGGAAAGKDLQVQINQVRLNAEEDAKRAAALDVPGEMSSAQQNLMLVLNLRAQALTQIAEKLSTAQGRGAQAQAATTAIAGQMQNFLASDVVYSQRTAPLIKQALDEAGISGQTIPASRSLRSFAWLAPQTVADAIGGQVVGSGGGTSGAGTCPAGQSCGHGLDSVSIGSTTLQSGGASNSVPAKPPPTVIVKFTNQGTNNEQNVAVTVKLTAPGAKPVTARQTVPQTTAGSQYTVSIKLPTAPAAGTVGTLDVAVAPVPGEKTVDNNKGSYTILFTG